VKQLTIISGKGGTGKTSITAAFASIAKNTVFADCDVDAADLHLIFKPKVKKTIIFKGLKYASVDISKCTFCMKCVESCVFNAIDKKINVNNNLCEGCGVCKYICPINAIKMIDRESGYAYISESRFGPLSHAVLNTAEEASGKLVTIVRENAKKIAEEMKKNLILIDGPPGIGCPVISSITGVDLVLIVTEPTLSAIHDLNRIYNVSNHFKIPSIVCINKYDINHDNTLKIEEFCENKNIPIVGKIPYDNMITKSMVNEQSIIEYSNGNLSKRFRDMWENIKGRLEE
jgi:MinD superfamily P-loop ATPase